jgi:hypothetical protein
MINPGEPKIRYKGDIYFDPQFLEKICIDYHNRKIRGSLRYKKEYLEKYGIKPTKGTNVSKWFSWDDPRIHMVLSDQEPSYG